MSVDVRTDGGLSLSAPRVVTRRARDFSTDYGVFPDDQSFLFMEAEGDRSRFIMVLNFFEELKSRVPN